ncbi:MAG TPA: helix-turn-helix domain-containing protein [Gemmatimonadaceae bacterium]|nr:helix-turn-helix domain-containing protein [Gemmatimonadaceae bacterium]
MPPLVIALVVGRRERARVQEALRGRLRLTFASTVEALRAQVVAAAEGELAAVIVEPRDEASLPVHPFVRDFVGRAPAVPVVAICDGGLGLSRDLLDLAQAGTHEVVIRGHGDDGHGLRAAIESGQRTSAGTRTLALLAPHVPPSMLGFVEYCVYYPHEAKSVTRVAAALGVHRKTLVNMCGRAGLPTPQVLISWCRVLHAAVLLSSTTRPVDQIARLLDFQSGTALRNMFKRYTGMRPGEVRGDRILPTVVASFAIRAASPSGGDAPARSRRRKGGIGR